ncbi:pseudouridine synthase, partial [Hyaloraphidium curvatum]
GLRKVQPYDYTFQSYAKERWLGKSLIEVMRREFHDQSEPYYREAIKTGRLMINSRTVDPDYVFKNGDLMQHRVHRHEPPVTETAPELVDLVMVNKPSSIPVHPSGRYHHNSVTRILHTLHPELFPHKNGEITKVFPCNRLDRLTSGLLVMALSPDRAREFESYFAGRKVGKWYVCRVKGDFPSGTITVDAPLMVYEHKLGVNCVSPNGKPATTIFEKLSYNGHTSVVQCQPLTGRTHQIRVHLRYLGHPIANDPLYAHRFWDEEAAHVQLENGEGAPGSDPHDVIPQAETLISEVGPDPAEDAPLAHFCADCRTQRPDPLPDQLGIWLHAVQYEFPPSGPSNGENEGRTWSIRSPLPAWAVETFADDRRIVKQLQEIWESQLCAVQAD